MWFEDSKGDGWFHFFPLIIFMFILIIIFIGLLGESYIKSGIKERDIWVKTRYNLVWDSKNLEYVERKDN